MGTFAITRAVLDSRIDKVLELFRGQNAEIKGMQGDISAPQEGQEKMRGDIKALEKSMLALQKSVNNQIALYGLLMIGTAIGLGIAVLTPLEHP